MFPILYFLPYENLHMEIENSKCFPFYFAGVEIRDLYSISFLKFKCTTRYWLNQFDLVNVHLIFVKIRYTYLLTNKPLFPTDLN